MSSEISRRRVVTSGGLAVVTAPLLVACGDDSSDGGGGGEAGGGGSADASTSLLERAKERGYLRVAIANEPPYTKVLPDGTVTGAEPEIFRAVVKMMGIPEIQGVVTGYDTMIPGLQADRWDAITAGLFMKQSRCAEVAYSLPTVVSTESYAVPEGNPKGLMTIADAVEKDVKIAVLPGGFEQGILKKAGVPDSRMIPVKNGQAGIQTVMAGRADAFLLPTLSLKALQSEDTSFEITPPIEDAPKTGAGSAFRTTDKEFRDKYNEKLAEFKKTDEFEKLMEKWGFSAKASREATTEELCNTPG